MAIISKGDFSQYVQFTLNISDRILNAYIEKAEKLDFKGLVPADFYTAVVNSASSTQLMTFKNTYIVPVLVHMTFLRMYIEHGANVSQFGITRTTDTNFEHVSEEQRAAVRNQTKTDLQSYLKLFYNELENVDYTFDGVLYDFDCKKKQKRIGISAI